MRSVEQPYAHDVAAEKNRYIAECAALFPMLRRLGEVQLDYHRAMLQALAMKYQGMAMKVAIREALPQVKAVKYDWEKLWLYLVRKWMSEQGARQARETAETTRDDMQKILDASLAHDEEFNPIKVATDLLRARELSVWRAETIARTETHNAMMFASVEGAQKVSIENDLTLNKKWVPVLDARTRVSHAYMHSHPAIALDAKFNVDGVQMLRPGDPAGGAKNCINCRCVLAYEVVE